MDPTEGEFYYHPEKTKQHTHTQKNLFISKRDEWVLRLEGNTCLLLLEGQFTRNHSAEKKGNDTCNVLSGHKKDIILDQTQRDTDTDFIVSSDCAIFSARVSIKSCSLELHLKLLHIHNTPQ